MNYSWLKDTYKDATSKKTRKLSNRIQNNKYKLLRIKKKDLESKKIKDKRQRKKIKSTRILRLLRSKETKKTLNRL